ncbi:MAG: glutamate--tRNA ligase [Candidatus Nealsonbacteria bacterium RIFCSPLOWO2_01_FULL_43_32]|uniref:Glutamate--tRNA ligase n=1 Tax=Candidatus Nealsonbacteria bacterium RIFCSPLOWO2_01_FULL_43_32 TaxID=1801672 RepID=A0A1G2EHF5_9BACT|nr:MAG: glutamate--tRNA ligase [Candidatus Nealsonbacteria bacterium RIFCSPLOWO2_01_FULL_43_32]
MGGPRVRMAPSPTGLLHVGLARTALFNYLFAQKEGGKFILRIEDTDRERSDPKFEKDIVEGLQWLGIKWDEFYRQSERIAIYTQYLEKLLKESKAYYCFCSEDELESKRQDQMSRGEAPKYNGKCRELQAAEVKKYLAENKPSIIRFKATSKKVMFHDLIRGQLEFDSSLVGDIAIAKDLATPLYNFAVVVDDFAMKITHVIRGEDHISNTPKQILLQEALDFPQVQYAHLPLILGPDRSKLSKRHGAVSVADYKKDGYLPETLVNFMAFLGWNPGGEREIFNLPSLVKEFSLENVQKSGAIFNLKRLDYLNGFYIRQKSIKKLAELCKSYLPEADQSELEKIVGIYQERLKKLSEIKELAGFFFQDKLVYDKELLKWKNMTDKEISQSLDKSENLLSKIKEASWTKENIEKVLMPEAERVKDRGYLLWPLRVALTGQKASAGPFEIAAISGKEKTLKRIQNAKLKMQNNN